MTPSNKAANRLAIRRYLAQIWRERRTALPAMVLPGIGSIFTTYVPPLIVAAVLNRYGGGKPTLHDILPYLLLFGGSWLAGEAIWRVAFVLLNRADSKS